MDFPIVLRKGTRTCIQQNQQPLYPLPNFLSFKKVSLTHKNFLINLNSIITYFSISKALFDKKCKEDILEALNKNKTLKLVTLLTIRQKLGVSDICSS